MATAGQEQPMPRYFFDVVDGRRLVDARGIDCKNDDDALERAPIIVAAYGLGHPDSEPKGHIVVIGAGGDEIGRVPMSRPPKQ